jgi:hypothetical protein
MRVAFDQLHDEIGLADVVELADVRVIELRDRFRLALESQLQLCIGRELRGKDLDGDLAVEPRIARAPHFAHTAGADRRDDLVRTQPAPTLQCHAVMNILSKAAALPPQS